MVTLDSKNSFQDDDVKAQLEKPKIPHPPPEELLPDLNIKPFGDEVPNNVIVGVKKAVYLEPDTAGKNVEIGGNAKVNEEKQKEKKENQDPIKEIKEDIKVIKNHIESLKEGKVVIQNGTKLVEKMNATEQAVLKKVESKVLALGESMKNKTLQKLADLGVYKKKQYEKLIYQHTNWNLSLSVEDIGNIIKDTEYFQKKQNLTEMEYQPLMQPNSSHLLNVTAAKYGLGYCDCQDLSCLCCVRVFNKRMRLNSTSCAAIVYSSKSLELQYEFSVDKKQYFSRVIAAEFPPKICLEAAGKVAGLCTLFSNVTAKVNVANEDHKIHLSGCMEFDLTVYNKTVSSFPVGCFQIPGLSSVEKEKNKAPNMINFMP
ncbi:hypothetical protein DPMN_065800 [Dreissena polymorpha]|uniref:DUF4773 domain-containing protein n=1 Tax=Dreissena polymorpha TaxID=45954 RepID=A0A9D4BSC1_DREPO|nr:hypothetical protein DPMN_065800 [Dreissena polymorpha]